MTRLTVEQDGSVRLPAEWMREFGSPAAVEAERTEEGIVLRPVRRLTWDEVFQHKVSPGTAEPKDLEDLTNDDLLW